MIDYLFIVVGLILSSTIAEWLGFNAAWGTIPFLLLAFPSLYATLTTAPHIPSDQKSIHNMQAIANIQPDEIVVDLGCGDGKILQHVKKKGARAIGYELSIFLWMVCKLKGLEARWQNFWTADISQADVVICFLMPNSMTRIRNEIWPKLKPGCRLIVSTFPVPDLKPTAVKDSVYLYVK